MMIENIPYAYLHKLSNGQFKISLKLKATAGNSHTVTAPASVPSQTHFELNADEKEGGVTNLSAWYPDQPSNKEGAKIIIGSLAGIPPWKENTCKLMVDDQNPHQDFPANRDYLPHIYLTEEPKDSGDYVLYLAIDFPAEKGLTDPEFQDTINHVRKVVVNVENVTGSTGGTFAFKSPKFKREKADYIEVVVVEGANQKGGGKIRHTLADPKPTPWKGK